MSARSASLTEVSSSTQELGGVSWKTSSRRGTITFCIAPMRSDSMARSFHSGSGGSKAMDPDCSTPTETVTTTSAARKVCSPYATTTAPGPYAIRSTPMLRHTGIPRPRASTKAPMPPSTRSSSPAKKPAAS